MGIPVVELMAPAALELCEATPSGIAPRCSRPAGASVDARGGQEYFLRGPDYLDSDRFRLDDRGGKVSIRAAPATLAARRGAAVLVALGSAATLACGVGLLAVAPVDGGPVVPLGGCLGGGLLSMAVSVPLLVTARTTFTLSSIGTYHF
jgi:hypothetical protein